MIELGARVCEEDVPVQLDDAVRVANLAFCCCASSAFCFWKLAGAACANAARTRRESVDSLAETMVTWMARWFGQG